MQMKIICPMAKMRCRSFECTYVGTNICTYLCQPLDLFSFCAIIMRFFLLNSYLKIMQMVFRLATFNVLLLSSLFSYVCMWNIIVTLANTHTRSITYMQTYNLCECELVFAKEKRVHASTNNGCGKSLHKTMDHVVKKKYDERTHALANTNAHT